MQDTFPPLAYAPPGLDQPADRLLRRIVGWLAILFGGESLVGSALHYALAKGWLSHPANMSWSIDDSWQLALMAVSTGVKLTMFLGGVLLLRQSRTSILLLRAGAACTIGLSLLGLALLLRTNPTYASYWSTPATAAIYTMQSFQSLWLPLLVGLLTLPPLARRMV